MAHVRACLDQGRLQELQCLKLGFKDKKTYWFQ